MNEIINWLKPKRKKRKKQEGEKERKIMKGRIQK